MMIGTSFRRRTVMATSSPGTRPSDALSRLRIQHTDRRTNRSWFGRLVRLTLALVAGLAVVAGGLVLASRKGWISAEQNWLSVPEALQSRTEARLAVVTVETGRAADATVVATGYLESRRQARIGARAPGRLQIINVEEGSRVAEGDVLAVLEHADLEASLAACEATLERAKAALGE